MIARLKKLERENASLKKMYAKSQVITDVSSKALEKK